MHTVGKCSKLEFAAFVLDCFLPSAHFRLSYHCDAEHVLQKEFLHSKQINVFYL